MFEYPEMQTVNHNGRWYETPTGDYYPSITTILGTTAPPEKVASLENWRNSLGHEKAAAVSKAATDRGTNVHLLAERYLKKEKVDAPIGGRPVPQPDLASFNALKLKLDKIDQVWGQEVPLCSPTLEVAGRCDLIGQYKGVPCIVDFKTASRVKKREDIWDYELQLLFYATAHNEMFETNIERGVILMVADTGFPMEFIIDFNEKHIDALCTRVENFWSKVLNKAA